MTTPAAFSVTFLGHQGWLVRSGRAALLVDPVLCEHFGDAYALGYRVHPPREIVFDAFPAIDALVLTHEHDDHFDLPSLARLDRRVPVHLSMHSSSAAFQILREMGFAVRPLVPGVPLAVADLEVIPFCGEHLQVNCDDEWDALPFMVRHREGAGSFFTMVDLMMVPGHLAWAKACAPRPGLVTWTNNTLDWGFMADDLAAVAADDASTAACVRKMESGRELIRQHWGTPEALLMCAGGFTFHGDRAWLNDRVFGIDPEAACRTMSERHAGERFQSALPGQTFHMEASRLVGVDERTPFLGTTPRATWPARRHDLGLRIPDYAPATGRVDLPASERARLFECLQEFAGVLVGGILFRSLHSLLTGMVGTRKPTFALILRHGADDEAQVVEYDANGCAFAPVDVHDPTTAYLAGMECWATDLLAVLTGALGPIALAYGRARLWNAMPGGFRFDLFEALYRTSHPLRRPAAFLATYRRLVEQHSSAPAIPASRDAALA